MQRGPLIILGASVRAAAQAAIRAGFRPYPIDLFADLDLQHLEPVQIERYPSGFLPALAAAPQAPWMYTGSLENYPRLVERLAKLRPLVGNGPEVLRKVRDPLWLAEIVAGTGMKFPAIRNRESGVRNQELGGNWLWKPSRSGGGMGIKRLPTSDSRFPTPASGHYCQQFISGQTCSASFVAINGQVHWIGAAEQWIGSEWGAPREFQYAGSLAPLDLTAAEQAALLRLGTRLTEAAGLQGLFGCDFIRNDQGLWLIEVNPRYTASMELFEFMTPRSHIEEHFGELPTQRAYERPGCAAKLIVYADRPGRCTRQFLLTVSQSLSDAVSWSDVPRIDTEFEIGNPICTLLTHDPDREPRDLIASLRQDAAMVRGALEP